MIPQIAADVRYALRSLRKSPGFAAVAIATLALGIGANTAIFSAVDAVVLRPLPYREPDRLAMLWERRPDRDHVFASYPDFRDWRERTRSFAGMAAYSDWTFNLTGAGAPEHVESAVVSASFFRVLGLAPEAGRDFLPEEDVKGRGDVAVLAHDFFVRRFGGDRAAVGRTITLDGKSFTIVGVAPAGIRLPSLSATTAIFVPMANGRGFENRGGHYLSVVARLKPGVRLAAARSDLASVARRLQRLYPATNANRSSDAFPLPVEIAGRARSALYVLFGAVFLLLMIASVNVANMLLSRATARRREIAVRAAIGAGRGRIVAQLLAESVVLASIGGALGVGLAVGGVALIRAFGPGDIPRLDQVRVDGVALAYASAISLATGLLFGVAPALHAVRGRLYESLKQGDPRAAAPESRAGRLLVVAEFALSVMLLLGAGLMLKSFWRLRAVDPGFRSDGILTGELDFPESRYPRGRDIAAFGDRLLALVRALPGVRSAGAISNLPLRGDRQMNLSFVVEGRPVDRGNPLLAVYASTTPGFFSTVGLPLLRGRDFRESDTRESPKVAIVNRRLADNVFPGQDPVGRRISLEDPPDWFTIVGVVGDARTEALASAAPNQLYMPYSQNAQSGMAVALRTVGDPDAAAAELRRAVAAVDPEEAVYGVLTMDEIVGAATGQPRFRALLTGLFAGLALLLAAIGIYGVLSYSVARRVHEIGIRVALGAGRSDVLRLVVGRGMLLAAAGVGVGLAGGALAGRFLAGLLYGVAPADPVTFVAVPAVLMSVALGACLAPAVRALRVDPTVALREE
ncbi:MAG TPA: ABC transporter permease [Thermoanaerobaculia bacterium]|nr:ABC transporter permease [Thermoanaerobaculia bacterium]